MFVKNKTLRTEQEVHSNPKLDVIDFSPIK